MHAYTINLLEGEAKQCLTPWPAVVISQRADQRQSVQTSTPPAALGEAGRGKQNRIGEEAIDTAKGLEAIRVVGGVAMLLTRFTELLGCTVPLQQAGMGKIASPALAAAVADAGGLGMVSGIGAAPP